MNKRKNASSIASFRINSIKFNAKLYYFSVNKY